MTKIQRYCEGDGDNDKLSRLPTNVIDLIMKLLPVRDAARTCVWSSKWRYVWADHPSLVLDKDFWEDIKRNKLSSKPNIDFACIVNRILLCHTGNLQKFVVDISGINLERHSDINLWLSVVCRRGLKELSIVNSKNNTYTIPSCVFFALELNNLSISNCIIKSKETLTGFNRLQSLTLNYVTLNSWILKTPLLAHLGLKNCFGVRGFSICAPQLTSLTFMSNGDFNLIPYLLCSNITSVYISLKNKIHDIGGGDCVNLLKLFSSWPNLGSFVLDGSSLKYLTTGIVLDNLSSVLNLTRLVLFRTDLDQASWILRILGNSPFLETFEMWLPQKSRDKALDNLEEQNINFKNMKMEQLHTVKIRFFKGSKSEVQFVKILLHCSPSLEQMLVEEITELTSDERLKISKELMRFQRAYPKPEIIFGSYY